MIDKRVVLILEFGIPPYRKFLFDYFSNNFKEFIIIHNGERFGDVSVPKFSKKGRNFRLFSDISLTFFDSRLIKDADIVITTFNLRKPHTWLPIFFTNKRKRWILWGHGFGKSKQLLIKALRKTIVDKAYGFVTYTGKGKSDLIEAGVNPEKISVAYNTLKINNASRTIGKKYLLYVGRIQERKGLMKALQALLLLPYKMVIVGDGSYKSKLQDYIARNHQLADRIVFYDSTYEEEELKEYFSNAIAYVSPDHVGLGVVHSFAYGVPVITNRNRKHAPEFDYCSDSNSYLYDDDAQLSSIINYVHDDEREWDLKSQRSFEFYQENLSYMNMINSFLWHICNND